MGRPRTYSNSQIERARKKARKGGWTLKKQTGTAYRAVRAKKSTSTRRRTTRPARRSNPAVVRRSGRMNTRAMNAFYNVRDSRRFSGKTYRKHTTSTTKNEAAREASRIRRGQGVKARVVKSRFNGSDVWTVYRNG